MTKNVDLNSKRWLDLVFEGKNKKFGAYELRESSSRRHVLAIVVVAIVIVVAVLSLVFLPRLMKQPVGQPMPVVQQGFIEFIDTPILPEQMPARAVEVQIPATPTLIQRTIGFTEPIIVVNTEVRPEDLMLTQNEYTDSNAAIGRTTNNEGGTVGRHPDDPASNTGTGSATDPDTPRITAEVWPEFKGDLMRWLGNNLRYPVDALEAGIEGKVTLRFVVQKDGTIGNVEVLQKLYPSCDKEAVRVVNKMPKWNPGFHGDRAVAVYYTLPIHFRIQR